VLPPGQPVTTSAEVARAVTRPRSISVAAHRAVSKLRSAQTTRAPAPPRPTAMARPSPFPAPVTTPTCSRRAKRHSVGNGSRWWGIRAPVNRLWRRQTSQRGRITTAIWSQALTFRGSASISIQPIAVRSWPATSESRPSWCTKSAASITSHSSTIMPPEIRRMLMEVIVAVFPVGGTPRYSPR